MGSSDGISSKIVAAVEVIYYEERWLKISGKRGEEVTCKYNIAFSD